MGFFDKLTGGHHEATPGTKTFQLPLEVPGGSIPVASHQGGVLKLSKGASIQLKKASTITASCFWPPATDYDVYALVLYRDGHVEAVSQFGTQEEPRFTPVTTDGAVRHQGDVGRSSQAMAQESLELRLNPSIAAVVPVVYSAQSNGTGSFHRYQVSMAVDNGEGQRVEIKAEDASDDERIYSCIPGVIVNSPEGVQVVAAELYSARNSERRPAITPGGLITMDAGPTNNYK